MSLESFLQDISNSELRQQFPTEIIPQGENYVLFRTQLFDLPWDIPQTRGKWDNCKGGTWDYPCPTWSDPFRMCRGDWFYPCWKLQRRTVRYGFVLEHRLPANLAKRFEQQLRECHRNALEIAKDIVYQGALSGGLGAIFGGNPLTAPLAAIQEAFRAIPVGVRWYLRMMEQCVERIYEGLGREVSRIRPVIRRIKTKETPWK